MIYTVSCMPQLNINLTPEFLRDLEQYMKRKLLSTKSEAIREAVRDALTRLKGEAKATDFRNWRGMALKSPLNPRPRFKDEDGLWT